jgi:glycosyltransferase involved in cell wall biosynthesis
VLFVSASGDYYGAPRSMHLLIDGLRQKGYRVEVALAAPGILAARLQSAGVTVAVSPIDPYAPQPIRSRLRGVAGWIKFWNRVRWGVWLARLVRRRRPKIVYINTLRGASGAVAAWLMGAKVVWHLRGLEAGTGNPLYQRLRLRLVRALADHVVSVSEATARPLRELGCPSDRISVVYNGIDPAFLNDEGHVAHSTIPVTGRARTSEVIVAYLGRLDPHKGVLDYLRAATLYCHRYEDARFVLVGGPVGKDNPDWPQIAAAASDAVLKERVQFIGFVSEPQGFLATCDIITLPSHAEGLPRSVLEAMALEKAVVATSVGGIPEVLVDGEHGLLVPPAAPDALVQAWKRLVKNRDERRRLGCAAAARVRTHFSAEACTEGVEAVLRKMLSS